MGASHAHPLYVPGTSPLHRARPQCKIAATLLFVLAVRPDLVHGAADLQTPLVLDATPDDVAGKAR